jgi:hypothetical protein
MNLYTKLKVITDSYISFLHTLEGYSLDSNHGFDLYLKEIKAIELSRLHNPNFNLDTHNRAAQLWGKGPPDDPDTLITHVTSYGELQKKIKKRQIK